MKGKIFRSSVGIFFATILVKCFGMFKEIAVASKIGATSELDFFIVLFSLISVLFNMVFGSMRVTLIPIYTGLSDQAEKSLFLRTVLVLGSTVSLLLGLLIFCLGSYAEWLLLELALPPIAAAVLRISAIFCAFGGTSLLLHGVFNAHRIFVFPALTPVVYPIGVLAALLVYGDQQDAVLCMAQGLSSAALLELLLLLIGLKVCNIAPRNGDFQLTPEVRKFISQSAFFSLSAIATSALLLTDHFMAAFLSEGSVSVLNYAQKVPYLLMGLALVSFSYVILPYLSDIVRKQDWKEGRSLLRFYSLGLGVLSIFPCLLLLFFSRHIVAILFERGAFSFELTQMVSSIQGIYFLCVPLYFAFLAPHRLMTAQGRNRELTTLAVCSLFLNICLNLVFMNILGLVGIAWSTFVVLIFNVAILTWWARRTFSAGVNESD